MLRFTRRMLLGLLLVLLSLAPALLPGSGVMQPKVAHAETVSLDQSQTVGYGSMAFYNDSKLAQTFTAGMTGVLDHVSVLLQAYLPLANITVTIQTVANDLPSGTVIGTGLIDVSSVPGLKGWVNVPISGASVTAGTQYAIVLGTTGDAAYIWGYYDVFDIYPSGQGAIQFLDTGSGTWGPWQLDQNAPQVGHAVDMAFETYVRVPSPVQDQTVSFGPLPDKTYGDPPFTVSATASSGLPVSFAASGNCTIADTTVTITGAGNCTVTASQAGNDAYNPAPEVAQAFTIAKATATIVLGPLSATYNGSPQWVSVTTTPENLSGVSVTYDGTATAPTDAGSYSVVASLNNPNYQAADATGTLTINKAATSTTLVSSVDTAKKHKPTIFTATVTGSPIPNSGTVTFMDGTTALGTTDVNASGVATFTAATMTKGTHSLTAVYNGSSNFGGSTSEVLTLRVK